MFTSFSKNTLNTTFFSLFLFFYHETFGLNQLVEPIRVKPAKLHVGEKVTSIFSIKNNGLLRKQTPIDRNVHVEGGPGKTLIDYDHAGSITYRLSDYRLPFTGTAANGLASRYTCNNWTSLKLSETRVLVGVTFQVNSAWTELEYGRLNSCLEERRPIMCFESAN